MGCVERRRGRGTRHSARPMNPIRIRLEDHFARRAGDLVRELDTLRLDAAADRSRLAERERAAADVAERLEVRESAVAARENDVVRAGAYPERVRALELRERELSARERRLEEYERRLAARQAELGAYVSELRAGLARAS